MHNELDVDFDHDRQAAINWAVEVMQAKPLFLDTETTGLDDKAEICDIAVVDYDGVVLFDTLVKPIKPIPADASAVHGIDDAMVEDAPKFADISTRLYNLFSDRQVVIYNAAFDTRILRQVDIFCGRVSAQCAMEAYARYWGAWNDYHGSYTWQRLGKAAGQCGIEVPQGIHRARVDAELCRQVVKFMAAQQPKADGD